MAIRAGRPFRSRFATRLLAVFVVCTLLPLALSDVLATLALADLAESLETRHQQRTTRQVAMQIYDRLLAARATLIAVAEGASAGGAERSVQGVRIVHVAAGDGDGGRDGAARALLADWHAAGLLAGAEAVALAHGAARPSPVTLRSLPLEGGGVRVLLATGDPVAPAWLAEVDTGSLAAPLGETGATLGTAWEVVDAEGRAVLRAGTAPGGGATLRRRETPLSLAPDFAAADWQVRSWRGPPELSRDGVPLAAWLALVAVAATLATALLGARLLRRLLDPLRRLTEHARALRAGGAARVPATGTDEVAELGRAFNGMADRIDGQFRSLELLAAIDRDVLAGAPLRAVATRVADDLAALHGRVPIAIVWRAGARRSDWHAVVRGAPEAASGPDTALPVPLAVLADDAAAAPPVGSTPCSDDRAGAVARAAADGGFGAGAAVEAWRIGDADRTTGWLLVAGAGPDGTALRRLLGELRDRLALAFATRAREADMAWRASHDTLTGLANRAGLVARVDALVAERPSEGFALLFVDLDRFKDANDSFGHAAGDRLLQEAAQRLQVVARRHGGDAADVARQGGDEFVLLLRDARGAAAVAADAVEALGRPFRLGDEEHAFGASVGVVLHPEHGRTCDELLRRADTAMYAAKAQGRGRFCRFDPALEAAAHRRLTLPAALRKAIADGELVAWFQPRVCARTGASIGAETLVRWQHPERGLVPPHEFIAVAEESSLVEDIGRCMLDAACAEIAAGRRRGRDPGRLSVNVSARQLASGTLVDDVTSALARHGLAHDAIELEITESVLVDDLHDARAQLDRLRREGTTVALDDFGAGYSSLTILRGLPVDVLKIDRGFVVDLGTDEGALAVARAIAALARAFNLRLVAEGVETEAQARILAALGCDELQGYRYAKPMPPDAWRAWLDARADAAAPERVAP